MTEEKAMAKEGYMTGNQLRQYLHISTRKLKFLMDNDYIPHENTGHPTHKYLVKIEDAEAFNKRQHTDKKLIADLAGLFTSRTEHHPLPKAEVSEETLCEYRRFVEERFRAEPEALSVTRICELTSMVGMTVHRLIASGILYGTKVQGKTFCSKSTLIDYLASEDTFRNPTCEGCKELVRTFKRRKSEMIPTTNSAARDASLSARRRAPVHNILP